MGRFFRFDHEWAVPAQTLRTYDVLVDLESYPVWWRQVRAVGKLSADRGLVVCRSLLPYALTLELRAVRRDRDAGILAVEIGGDLHGWSRFTLQATGSGQSESTTVRYEQEVETCVGVLGLVPDSVLRANHVWMMRGAWRGLRAELAGR